MLVLLQFPFTHPKALKTCKGFGAGDFELGTEVRPWSSRVQQIADTPPGRSRCISGQVPDVQRRGQANTGSGCRERIIVGQFMY